MAIFFSETNKQTNAEVSPQPQRFPRAERDPPEPPPLLPTTYFGFFPVTHVLAAATLAQKGTLSEIVPDPYSSQSLTNHCGLGPYFAGACWPTMCLSMGLGF